MTRVLKRHLRAEHNGPHVEPGWPCCGVGPRYTVTTERETVTCERCAPGRRAAPEEDEDQLALVFDLPPAPSAPPVLEPPAGCPPELARVLALYDVRRFVAAVSSLVQAVERPMEVGRDVERREALREVKAWLRDVEGEIAKP